MSRGELMKEKLFKLPMANEFLPSEILVIGTNGNNVLAVCGIRSVFNILTLYVMDGYRGRGLGTQILEKTINVAQERGRSFISLAVLSDNLPALRLYHKFGFKEIMRMKDYVTMMLPLNLKGELFFFTLSTVCSKLPSTVSTPIARSIFQTTVADTPRSDARLSNVY